MRRIGPPGQWHLTVTGKVWKAGTTNLVLCNDYLFSKSIIIRYAHHIFFSVDA